MPSLKDDENKEQSVLSDDGGSKIHNPAAVMEDEAVNNHRSSSPVAIFSESASQPSAINNFDGTSKTTDNDVTKDYFGGDTTEAINKDGLTMEEEDAEEEEMMMSGQNATSSSRRSTNEESNNSALSSKEASSSEFSNESNGHDNTFGKGEMTKDSPGDEEEGRERDDFAMVSSGNANHHDESSTLVNNSNQQFLSFLPSSKQSSTNSVAFTRSSRNEKQDDYVKKGAHVKALLASAMQAVADGFAVNNKATAEDGSSDNNNNNNRSNNGDECGAEKKLSKKTAEDFVHMQELAQTKSEECIALKRKLDECQLQIQLHNESSLASEQNVKQLQSKIDRTLEALKIAGVNAANARAEADAANARTNSLSEQLNDFQELVDDTKDCMEVVRREHDEVSNAARAIESRLIKVESELTRAAKVKRDAEEERDILKARSEKSEKLVSVLQERVNDYQDEIRHFKKDMGEMGELEKMRSERTQRIELELQDARAGLLEATSAAAEAESTVTSLRSVIEELRRDNESLHVQIDGSRDTMSKDRAKQNETLALVEKEAQKWRLKFEEVEEENRKLKMDKGTADKQVEQLKGRVANLERRINESKGRLQTRATSSDRVPQQEKNNVVTPKLSADLGVINAFGSSSTNDGSAGAEEGNKRKYVSELPMKEQPKNPPESFSRQLTYSSAKSSRKEKENESNMKDSFSSRGSKRTKKTQSTTSSTCCLCNREGGMILRCQCNNANCELRAHPMCIGKFRLGKSDNDKTILCSEA